MIEHVYSLTCGRCQESSPEFVSSELLERWLIAHYSRAHPQQVEVLAGKLVDGWLTEWVPADEFIEKKTGKVIPTRPIAPETELIYGPANPRGRLTETASSSRPEAAPADAEGPRDADESEPHRTSDE